MRRIYLLLFLFCIHFAFAQSALTIGGISSYTQLDKFNASRSVADGVKFPITSFTYSMPAVSIGLQTIYPIKHYHFLAAVDFATI